MNYHKLKKKATPGPLHMKRLSSDEEGCVDDGITLHGADGGMVAHTYGNPEEFLLIAHCTNKFDKALSELKEAQRELDMLYAHALNTGIAEAGDPPHKRVARAIKELETVED